MAASRLRLGHGRLGIAIGALVMLSAGDARAEQFVLFDATFTYTWDDAVNAKPSKSHYYVNEGNWLNKQRPANWMSPVNYRDGKVHIRAEVLEKPAGTQQAGWGLCYVANVGGYGCPYTDYYKATGIYERDVDMHTFYNNTTLQWDRGVKQVDLVYTVNGSGSGHITNYPELKDLVTPTKVRITMVQVSMGATYDPSWLAAARPPEAPVEPARDGGGGARDASGDLASDAGSPVPVDAATPEPTGAAGAGAGGDAGASGGAGAGGATTPPLPPTTGAAGAPATTGAAGAAPTKGLMKSSGCAVAPGDSGLAGLLALLALARLAPAASRRRR